MKPQTIVQNENIKRNLLRKLVANARNVIANDVGLSVGVWKMNRLISWLKQSDVHLAFPVFDEYSASVMALPSGKERLHCSRDALRQYDGQLNQINLNYHDRVIDACFEIIDTYSKLVDNQDAGSA